MGALGDTWARSEEGDAGMIKEHFKSMGKKPLSNQTKLVNHGDFFNAENGFFKVSDDKYFFFNSEKVYLVHVQDLTVARYAAKFAPNFPPNR